MKRYDVKVYDRVLLKAICAGVSCAIVLWIVFSLLARLLAPRLLESFAGECMAGAIVILGLLAGGAVTCRFLRFPSRDEPVCQNCGYSLRGLSEPRCPECGEPFEPQERKDDEPESGRGASGSASDIK